MPRSPSIVPEDTNRDVYPVLDDFGHLDSAWRETDEAGANRATLGTCSMSNMKIRSGSSPSTPAQGWSRDVTVDIADELRRRYVEYDELPESVLKFLEATNRH